MDANCECLYHYTNVSSLALILKNQNMKFNPLTVLDDSEEEKIQDTQKYGKYCYVSSWTEDENESIPMWNMYTNISEGVRIKLPKYPFQEYLLNTESFDKVNEKFDILGNGFNIIIPPKDYVYQNYFLSIPIQNKILKKVIYTNDTSLLYPRIKEISNGKTVISSNKLGIYKNDYWSFQKEWRYKLDFFPFGQMEMIKESNNGNKELLLKLERAIDLPFNYYFLKLDREKFEHMEITLSPKINEGNRTIVKILMDKYNPNAKIFESELTGKIR